ncbi:MAG: hypothetical protein JSS66_02890 [Armatimonadetes bacterium]|nr:hypothetical protein [Armatimonadota bacterium]
MNDEQVKTALQERFRTLRFEGEVTPGRMKRKGWLLPTVAVGGLALPAIAGALLFFSPGCTYERAIRALEDAPEFTMEMTVDRFGSTPYKVTYEDSGTWHRRTFGRPIGGGVMVWNGDRCSAYTLDGSFCVVDDLERTQVGGDSMNPLPGEKTIDYVMRSVWLTTFPLTPGSEKPVSRYTATDEQGRSCEVLSFLDDEGYIRDFSGATYRNVRAAELWLEPGTGRPIRFDVHEPGQAAGLRSTRTARISYGHIAPFNLTSGLAAGARVVDLPALRSSVWKQWEAQNRREELDGSRVYDVYRSPKGWALILTDKVFNDELLIEDAQGRPWSAITVSNFTKMPEKVSVLLATPVEPGDLSATTLTLRADRNSTPHKLAIPAASATPPTWLALALHPFRLYKLTLQPPLSSANYYRSVRDWKNEIKWLERTLDIYDEYKERPRGVEMRLSMAKDLLSGKREPPPFKDETRPGAGLFAPQ